MKTKAVRIYGVHDLRLEEFELPQMGEDEIFCLVEDWLGCKVSRNPKIKMNNNDKVHIEPDFYSEEHSIIGEIFAHIGENKRGQSTKIANDILKMLLIEKDRCKSYRKIIVVCDEQEERTLSGKSALAESIRQFGIELKRVEISNELRETILSVFEVEITFPAGVPSMEYLNHDAQSIYS